MHSSAGQFGVETSPDYAPFLSRILQQLREERTRRWDLNHQLYSQQLGTAKEFYERVVLGAPDEFLRDFIVFREPTLQEPEPEIEVDGVTYKYKGSHWVTLGIENTQPVERFECRFPVTIPEREVPRDYLKHVLRKILPDVPHYKRDLVTRLEDDSFYSSFFMTYHAEGGKLNISYREPNLGLGARYLEIGPSRKILIAATERVIVTLRPKIITPHQT